MPDYQLPGGPEKVKIHNNSGDKDITDVRVGVIALPGGQDGHDDEHLDPAIAPGYGEVLTNIYATAPTATVCVTVFWAGGSATCCCSDTRLHGGIREVVATLDAAYNLNLWVRPFPTSIRAFACGCGAVPEGYPEELQGA